ncbi:MAG TPA: hypothetical protein VGJ20_01850 [Xanthobacteraceae bacterium]
MQIISRRLDASSDRTILAAPCVSALTDLQIGALAVLTLSLAAIPICSYELPPLMDYINHLARMHVIAAIRTDPDLARFYQIEWQILPNLAMDLTVPLLARVMTIYHAGQCFLLATFIAIMSGALALNRALFRRWSIVPLVASPLLYNYVFLTGVLNYLFGVGLALWALAYWIRARERPWPLRFAISTLFVIGLFFSHLAALGVYGIGLLATESLRLWSRRHQPLTRPLINFFATGLPFLVVVPMLITSPTLQLISQYWWQPRGKLDGLIYAVEAYSNVVSFSLLAIFVAGGTWLLRRRLLLVHPLCWALLGIGGLIYLLMPRGMFATYMTDQRLPVAIAFMLVACIDVDLRDRFVRRGFIATLIGMLVVRVVEVDVTWARLAEPTYEFRASVSLINKGSKVLVAYAKSDGGDDLSELGLVHAACIAMIERSALVTTAFTVEGKQILHARPEYQDLVDTQDGTPPTIKQLRAVADIHTQSSKDGYWRGWPSRYDYLYVLFTANDTPNPDPDHLTLLARGTQFQLYRIKAPQ